MCQASIYEKVLGPEFIKLHPKLQERYRIHSGESFVAKGIMKKITGGPRILYPLWWLGTFVKFLFPERGENISFTITNHAYISKKGEEEVHWERAFHFPQKTRYFNAVMSYDKKRQIIKDYLGEPSPLYSDLKFSVLEDGSLQIDSVKQRLVFGRIEIPLPRFLHGLASVRETYQDKRQSYTISVTVKNKLLGTIFAYEGEFHA